ncbi:MAG: hypothetical protein OXH38_00745 [Chloroflexi bacterium]|nr:hypothetical protein [Chloroflexota bacterium]
MSTTIIMRRIGPPRRGFAARGAEALVERLYDKGASSRSERGLTALGHKADTTVSSEEA